MFSLHVVFELEINIIIRSNIITYLPEDIFNACSLTEESIDHGCAWRNHRGLEEVAQK